MKFIGIDLGTTNSAIAFINEDGKPEIIPNSDGGRVTPSVILFEKNNVVVGISAKSNASYDPLNVVQFVKRQMGNPDYVFTTEEGDEYTSEELSALIIKKLLQDAENYLGEKICKAVVTVPAYFDDAKRQATIDAAKLINLDILKVINEPTAAALCYHGIKRGQESTIMVYDLGGGTFDATLMKMTGDKIDILGTEGDKNLGGFDFDNFIINHVIEMFESENGIDLLDDDEAMQFLREKAENIKIQLSSRNKAYLTINSQGKKLKIEMNRSTFEKGIYHLVERTINIVESVAEEAKVKWQNIDNILLVGGSSRIPLVESELKSRFNIKPIRNINADEAVALGAAIQASILDEDTISEDYKSVIINDVNSHSVGIIALNEDDKEENFIVLPRNKKLPATETSHFYLVNDNQKSIELTVTEGEDKNIDYVRVIGNAILDLPKGVKKGDSIKYEVHLDDDQILHVFAYLGKTNEYLGELHIERTSNLGENEIVKKKNNIMMISIS